MSLKTRGLVFATFFGSCLAVGLLLVSLTTDHWITATPKRYNSTESKGYINFGLFSGSKVLNVGYGSRIHSIDVINFMRSEPNTINLWLWLGTALGTGFALLSSAVAAIASVLKAATSSKKHTYMILLFIANCCSAISQILAFVCWLVQFLVNLKHNVLEAEDRKLSWYSHELSNLGFSFHMIFISFLFVIINIVILIIAYKIEKRESRYIEPSYEDKTQSAIMLY